MHRLKYSPTLFHNRQLTQRPNSRLLLVLTILIFANLGTAFAANHFVRAGATGNGSGSDWTNACTDFTGSCAVASLVRGDTYYVATGNYAGRTFNTPTSGTLRITIKGATVADHGSNLGWSDSLSVCSTQATWTNAWTVSTQFWVFDSQCYPPSPLHADGNDPTKYGFTVRDASACSGDITNIDIGAANITLKGISMTNPCATPPGGTQHYFGVHFNTGGSEAGYVFSHNYGENYCADYQGRGGPGPSSPLIEYHYSKGAWSTDNCHGEITAFGGSGATIRYNYFDQCQGTACIASDGPSMSAFKIYGNVMNNVTNGGTGCGSGGNGAIAGAGNASITNFEIYNNTIIQPGMCFGWFYSNGGGGNVAKNNIIKGNCDFTGSLTHDSNYYLSCNSGQAAPAETNSQMSSTAPFVNMTARDFHLSADTNMWAPVTSPFDIDPDGLPRTSSRGAFQFSTVTAQRPAAPQSLQATVR